MKDDGKKDSTTGKLAEKLANFNHRVISSDPGYLRRQAVEEVLPKGASLSKRAFWSGFPFMTSTTGAGGTVLHAQRPYDPEYETQDRQSYPKNRIDANRYWRLFYKLDPFFGTAMDMYSTLAFSDFDIVMDDVGNGSIKNTLLDMCSDVSLLDVLQAMVKEYLVIGEAVPHSFFDSETGLWSYISFHNPDHIDIQDAPIIDMEPIISYVPDDGLREMLSDGSVESHELRQRLPADFVSKVLARQKIPLSPVNCSFIPRKLHPYDIRGTSIGSRLWRIWCLEDSVFASTLATYRRHAAPLKCLKFGDPSTGYIPDNAEMTKMEQMLAQAELDPQAWITTHYAVNFEAWGGPDRAITINREYDTIDKLKLVATGLSKGFMSGEVSYACQFKDARILAGNGRHRDIADFEVGDLVIDRFGSRQKVTDVLKYPAPDEMVELSLYGNRKLTLTGNHELPVFCRPRVCVCGCGQELSSEKDSNRGLLTWSSFLPGHEIRSTREQKTAWVEYQNLQGTVLLFPDAYDPYEKLEAKDVKPGDWLMVSRKFEVSDTAATAENQMRARLLGYYAAAGAIADVPLSKKSRYTKFFFGMDARDEYYAKDCVRISSELGYVAYLTKREKKQLVVSAAPVEFSRWLDENGGIGSSKGFSAEIMGWNLALKMELLKGLFRGAGHLQKKGNLLVLSYTGISETLASQLELILAQLGYGCSRAQFEDDATGRSCWQLTITGEQVSPLVKMIWENVSSVQNVLDAEEFEASDNREDRSPVFMDEDYLYLPVESVRKVQVDKEENPYVYSLTVDKTNSYTVGIITSYNSVKGGLQVFLRRLLSLRQYLESVWLYPKFFDPIVEINEWTRSTRKEVNHRYRIKRSQQQVVDEDLYIKPRIKWKNNLDPKVESDLLQAYGQIKQFGFPVSMETIGSAVSLDYKSELEKEALEFKNKAEILESTLGPTLMAEYLQSKETQQPGKAPGGASKPPTSQKPPTSKGPAGGGGGAPGAGDAAVPLSDGVESPGEMGIGE